MLMRHVSEITGERDDYGNRNDWLLGRKMGVGASESACLFGCGYAGQSPISLYADKITDEIQTLDQSMIRRLRIGKQMEPVLRQIFEDETGMSVMDPGEFTIWRHPVYSYMLATLDGLCWNPELDSWCVVELKNVHHFNREEWLDDVVPPLKYAIQVQHQLAVTGLPVGYLLGLVGGQEPVVKTIERNDSFIDGSLVPAVSEFWQHVIRRELPPVDASEATKKALGRLYPEDLGEEILLPPHFDDLDEELLGLKSEIKGLEARKDAIENEIRAALGDATSGVLRGGGRYSWKLQERKAYTVEASSCRVLRRCK